MQSCPLCWVKVYELWFITDDLQYFTFVYNTYMIYTLCDLLHWPLIKKLDGKWIFISVALFQSVDQSKHFTSLVTYTQSYIHSYTDAMQGASLLIRSNLWFSILLKNALTCRWGSQGFKPSTLCILEHLLYLLSYSHLQYRLHLHVNILKAAICNNLRWLKNVINCQ